MRTKPKTIDSKTFHSGKVFNLTPFELKSPFLEFVSQAGFYAEWGAGSSTIAASNHGVSEVLSLESSAFWVARVAESCDPNRVEIRHLDIGPTRKLGHPKNKLRNFFKFPNYSLALEKQVRLRNGRSPDVVLIDGRFRLACFLRSYSTLAAGTIILFDDFDKNAYQGARRLLEPVRVVDGVAVFKLPERRKQIAAFLMYLTVCFRSV